MLITRGKNLDVFGRNVSNPLLLPQVLNPNDCQAVGIASFMMSRQGTKLTSIDREENKLAKALQYLLERSCQLATPSSLQEELSTVVTLVVPAFADGVRIDCFQPNGTIQRFAMLSSDDTAIAVAHAIPNDLQDHNHWLNLALHDGMTFWGTIHLMRLSSAEDYSEDERLDAKLLASRISARISTRMRNAEHLVTSHEAEKLQQISCDNDQSHSAEPLEKSRLFRIFAMVAHELRNPLSVFQTAVDLLENNPQACLNVHGMLKSQTEQMTRLVDELLDMSRFANGKVRLDKQPTPLWSVIDAAVQSVEQTISANQQTISIEGNNESIWINCDRYRMTQAIINLLSNASKFSNHGDAIHLQIRLDPDQHHVELLIQDQGIGIPAEELPMIFDFFAQSESSDSLKHSSGGLGIGLGLVKGIVELHGGHVWAESDGRGYGARFTVKMPTCKPAAIAQKANPVVATRNYRILIVDDRYTNAYLLTALLKKIGNHETRSAHNGVEALSSLNDFQPDLILLDLELPGMSGLELAKEIRKLDHCRNTLIVALTGYDDLKTREQARHAGVDLYRIKPASMEMLVDLFQKLNLEPIGLCNSRPG